MDPTPPIRDEATVGRQGRLVIPARIREALALREGERVQLVVSDGELHLLTVRASVERARRMLGVTSPARSGDTSWSDGLIAERRIEAASEDTDQ